MPALDGVTVIDLTRVLAGPFCTMTLGDMGAEVIKVEEPCAGDDTRAWAPFVEGWSSYFLGVNRNKKSLAVDLKAPEGREAVQRLARRADVFIENFRPGTLARFGLDFETLSHANPRLIYCSISGYGQTGPRSQQPGYDPVIQAEAGLMAITGFADRPPSRVGIAITDYVAGLYGVSAILLALRERDRTGRGQLVDIALFDTLMATMTLPVGIYMATGESPTRMGNQHPSITPYETFQARDGAIMVCVGNPRLWTQFCEAIGEPALASDERFHDNTNRLRHRAALVEAIESVFRRHTVDALVALLDSRAIPCGRVRDMAQALADPQVAARNLLVDVPVVGLGEVSMVASPIKLSETPAVYRLPPPRLGEHSRQVLRDVGYGADEIDDLMRRGVTRQAVDGTPAV